MARLMARNSMCMGWAYKAPVCAMCLLWPFCKSGQLRLAAQGR